MSPSAHINRVICGRAATATTTTWTPNSLSGGDLGLWMLSTTDNDANITASGSAVSKWTDKSSHAYTYSQGTGSSQPNKATVGSEQWLLFDGGDWLDMDSPVAILTVDTKFCVGMRIKLNTFPTNYPGFFVDGPGSPTRALQFFMSNDASYDDLNMGQSIGPWGRYIWDYTAGTPADCAFTIEYDGANETNAGFTAMVNSVLQTTTGPQAYADNLTAGRIGSRAVGAHWDGWIRDIVILTGAFSAADVTGLQAYVAR